MVVVARSVPAGRSAAVLSDGTSRHGLRLLLRQALLEGDEVDAGHGGSSAVVAAATSSRL